jgi:hypothetical protein
MNNFRFHETNKEDKTLNQVEVAKSWLICGKKKKRMK